jgi:hypothetical protein
MGVQIDFVVGFWNFFKQAQAAREAEKGEIERKTLQREVAELRGLNEKQAERLGQDRKRIMVRQTISHVQLSTPAHRSMRWRRASLVLYL